MNPLWLIRLAQWVRHPPSPGRAKLILAVVLACLLLAGAEWLFGPFTSFEPQRHRTFTP